MENNKSSEKLSINSNINKKYSRQSSLIISDDEKRQYFSEDNSYIEYFIEIGIKPSLFFKDDMLKLKSNNSFIQNLNPEIISKFPNFDKKSIIIDNTIIKTVFPKGFKYLETKNRPDPELYSIILDNQQCSLEHIHKYITCLIIYEKVSNYISLYYQYNQKTIDKNILEKYKQFYIPKCIAIVSLFPYIDIYEDILKSIYVIFLSKKINNLLLEEIILKLVIEVPRIPKGLKKIFLKLPDKSIELTENRMNELPKIHFNLSQAIGHFNLEDLIDIYTYLLMETKMIFFSKKIQELSNTILSFLDFLSPLKYQYQVVSVLPRELFSFCKTLSPFIFGINDNYYRHYFSKNKIDIEDSTICVVDIDSGKYFMIAPGSELDEKEYPELPKHLREKLSNKFNKYYQKLKNDSSKKNNIKEDNKKYQQIFYNFMLELFEDYPKYLNLDYGVRKTIKMHIKYLIDIENYVKSREPNERNFYQKILNTQMFIEFIYKRMMPKNSGEKIEALFFEEKIYSNKAKKKFFGKTNKNERNTLLLSKDYEYERVGVIIDLSNLNINSKEINKYFNDYINKDINKCNKYCLSKGFYIEKNNKDNKLYFKYYVFPLLINELIYKINKNNFHLGKALFKEIENINAKIVNKIHLKLQKRKKIEISEIENDIYLSYLIIWSLTFWYTDKEERDFRFYQMIEVLDRIEEHEIEIFEILFENVVKYSTEENIRYLYKKFIERKLNPSWKIFNLVSKYLKSLNKLKMISKSQVNIFDSIKEEQILSKSRSNKNIKDDKKEKSKNFNTSIYRLRTLKNLEKDENIFSNDVEFVCFSECPYCKKIINLAKLCSNLSTTRFIKDPNNGADKIKCPNKAKDNRYCDRHSAQKLKFQFGVELFNQHNESSCIYNNDNYFLLSPTTIKKKLLSIANLCKNKNFDVELFKEKYSELFWNCLWYFQLNDIEISFMLPYANNTKIFDNNMLFNLQFDTNKNKNIIKDKKDIKHLQLLLKDKNNINNNEIKIDKFIFNKYLKEDLCKQNIFQFSIIKDKGYINYIDIDLYNDNIGFNEIPPFIITIKKKKKKGLRDSFWFSFVNRIIDKTSEKINLKYATEPNISNLIKSNEEESNSKRNSYIDLNNVENDYTDEYSQSFNYSFKRRGTLTKGVFNDEEDNYLQNDSFDFDFEEE